MKNSSGIYTHTKYLLFSSSVVFVTEPCNTQDLVMFAAHAVHHHCSLCAVSSARQISGGGARTSAALGGLLEVLEEEDDSWQEETSECGGGAEYDGDGEGARLEHGSELSRGKIGRDEGDPDDAESVQGDVDVAGLVEILRDFPGAERKVRAEDEQQEVVAERNGEADHG